MVEQSESQQGPLFHRDRLEGALNLVTQCYDSLFEQAPLMMHSIDTSGRLIKVNRKWLETLGYDVGEVLGIKSTDFLTEESQDWAINDTLPLFWKTGLARSIGYEMVKKNGRVVNVLLDGDTVADGHGDQVGLDTIRENYTALPWRQSATLLDVLPKLSTLERRLQGMIDALVTVGGVGETEASPDIWVRNDGGASFRDTLEELPTLCRKIGEALRTVYEAQGLALHAIRNQLQVLLLVESTLDLAANGLAEIAEEWRHSSE